MGQKNSRLPSGYSDAQKRLDAAYEQREALFQKTYAMIVDNAHALKAFKALVAAGCNPKLLLRETGSFRGVWEEDLAKQAKDARAQLEKMIENLAQHQTILWSIVQTFMFDNYGVFKSYDSPAFSHEVFGSSRTLEGVAKPIHDIALFLKGIHLKSIRNRHLLYLYLHIKAATKGDDSYEKEDPLYDIACLVSSMPPKPTLTKKKGMQRDVHVMRPTKSDIVKLRATLENTIEAELERHRNFYNAAQKAIERDLKNWQTFFK